MFCQVRGPDGQTTEQYDVSNVANDASIQLGMDELEFVGGDSFQAPGGRAVAVPANSINAELPAATAAAPEAISRVVSAPTPAGTSQPGDQSDGTNPSSTPASTSGSGAVTPTGLTTLTFIALTCPKGYRVFAASANPETDCSDLGSNVPFALESSGNETAAQITGADGVVTFSDLQAGAFQLSETFPAGVTSAFLGSCSSDIRDFSDYPFLPFAEVGFSAVIGLTVKSGEHMQCARCNVPSKSATAATASPP